MSENVQGSWAGKPGDQIVFVAPGLPGLLSPAVGGPRIGIPRPMGGKTWGSHGFWCSRAFWIPLSSGRRPEPCLVYQGSGAGRHWDPMVFGAPELPGLLSPAVGGPSLGISRLLGGKTMGSRGFWCSSAPWVTLSGGRRPEPWDSKAPGWENLIFRAIFDQTLATELLNYLSKSVKPLVGTSVRGQQLGKMPAVLCLWGPCLGENVCGV